MKQGDVFEYVAEDSTYFGIDVGTVIDAEHKFCRHDVAIVLTSGFTAQLSYHDLVLVLDPHGKVILTRPHHFDASEGFFESIVRRS